MTSSEKEPFDEWKQAQVLLHEYDTLRQEMIQRTNNGYQLTAAITVVAVWLFSQKDLVRAGMVLSCSIAVFAILGIIIIWEIQNAARQVRVLESRINSLAGEEKQMELLTWETKHGGAAKGFVWRKK